MDLKPYALRPAAAKDAARIRALVWQAKLNPSGLKWSRFVVAETAVGEVIGCGQVKSHLDGTRELASIVVDPAWQGYGAGRAIIESLLAAHPGELYLMCLSSMEKLYEKFGFQVAVEAETPRYYLKLKRLSQLAERWMPEGQYISIMKRAGGV